MNNYEETTYGELQNGDRIYIQGYVFTVTNIRVASRKGEKTSMHGKPNRADVIRFEGVTDNAQLANTSYNGGTYGGYADVTAFRIVATPCVDCGVYGDHHCPAFCDVTGCERCSPQHFGR